MKQTITFERLMPDTVRGEAIVIKQVFSDFDKEKIDTLEKQFENTIGIGIVSEYNEGKNE